MCRFERRRFQRDASGSMLFFAQGQYVGDSRVIRSPGDYNPAQRVPLPKGTFSRPIKYGC